MAMLAIKGIYAEYQVERLNHGIGFDTLPSSCCCRPTADLGLKGKIARHWALNPHPALIPAIEAGFVESVHSFGSELGMENYTRARPDVFFVVPDGSMRSNSAFSQAAGHYACDMFIGSTLQIDLQVIRRPRPWAASPALALRRTWAPMRKAGATREPPGLRRASRRARAAI